MRKSWIAKHCITDGEYQRCKICQSFIEIIGAYMSLHDTRFPGCAGSGRVMRLVIPFCPKCETRPSEYGCIHEQEAWHN